MKFKPIFVTGNSRSGTTLMATILGRSAEVFTAEELHFFERYYTKEYSTKFITKNEARIIIGEVFSASVYGYYTFHHGDEFKNEIENVLISINDKHLTLRLIWEATVQHIAIMNGKSRFCDQTPQNSIYAHDILVQYPKAKFIHMVRDPRDVFASQKLKWKRAAFSKKRVPLWEAIRTRANYHPIMMSLLWRAANSNQLSFDNEHVKYQCFEDLLITPEDCLHKVCFFLEIEFSAKMLDVPSGGSSFESDGEVRGINKNNTRRWVKALNSTEVFICEKFLGKMMIQYGYNKSYVKPNLLYLVYYVLTFPLFALVSLLFNVSRHGNIVNAIVRRLSR